MSVVEELAVTMKEKHEEAGDRFFEVMALMIANQLARIELLENKLKELGDSDTE